jgi:hypothetical protein
LSDDLGRKRKLPHERKETGSAIIPTDSRKKVPAPTLRVASLEALEFF